MTEEINLDFNEVEDLIAILKQSASQMANSSETILGLAASIQDGAMIGEAGDAFAEAFRDGLSSAYLSISNQLMEKAVNLDVLLQQFLSAQNAINDEFRPLDKPLDNSDAFMNGEIGKE